MSLQSQLQTRSFGSLPKPCSNLGQSKTTLPLQNIKNFWTVQHVTLHSCNQPTAVEYMMFFDLGISKKETTNTIPFMLGIFRAPVDACTSHTGIPRRRSIVGHITSHKVLMAKPHGIAHRCAKTGNVCWFEWDLPRRQSRCLRWPFSGASFASRCIQHYLWSPNDSMAQRHCKACIWTDARNLRRWKNRFW